MRAQVGGWLAVGVLSVATVASAADSSQPSWRGAVWPDQWRAIPKSSALDIPSPITRDEEVQRVTLKETIAIALENNPGIAARRMEPALADARVLGAQSIFDPALGIEAAESRVVTPNASSLSSIPTSVIED